MNRLLKGETGGGSNSILLLFCVISDLLTIRHQLPPDHCILNQKRPYLQRCSLTIATKWPKAT